MISTTVTRASAIVLLAGGVTLLFAADVVLPLLVPGYPAAAAWLGQLLGAAWLGMAALNWLQQGALLGGIYGRPLVLANLTLYFVGAMVTLRALREPGASSALWWIAAPMSVLAVVYGVLLLRGPLDPLGEPTRR